MADLDAAHIVRAVAESDPLIPSEVDGDLYCFYCGEWFSGLTPKHGDDCVWVAAKTLNDFPQQAQNHQPRPSASVSSEVQNGQAAVTATRCPGSST